MPASPADPRQGAGRGPGGRSGGPRRVRLSPAAGYRPAGRAGPRGRGGGREAARPPGEGEQYPIGLGRTGMGTARQGRQRPPLRDVLAGRSMGQRLHLKPRPLEGVCKVVGDGCVVVERPAWLCCWARAAGWAGAPLNPKFANLNVIPHRGKHRLVSSLSNSRNFVDTQPSLYITGSP